VRLVGIVPWLVLLAVPILAACGAERAGGAGGGLRDPIVAAGDPVLSVYAAIAPAACRDALDQLDARFVAAATARNASTGDRRNAAEYEASVVVDALEGVLVGCLHDDPAWDDAVEPLEAVAAEAVGLVVRSTVQCDSSLVWERSDRPTDDGGAVLGYLEASDGEVHLSPATCLHLARVIARPELLACVELHTDEHWACPPSAAYAADALGTLVHEAQHVSGEEDEARTECYALQTVDDLAVRLGVAEAAAEPIGGYLLRVVARPDEYTTVDCRRDGPLDIEPETPSFP
jgi:hypothetical protein